MLFIPPTHTYVPRSSLQISSLRVQLQVRVVHGYEDPADCVAADGVSPAQNVAWSVASGHMSLGVDLSTSSRRRWR